MKTLLCFSVALSILFLNAEQGFAGDSSASSGGSGSGGSSSGGGYSFERRAEARKASRWTLQEWLERKDRMAMMDMWLTFNSPSPYEFSLAGAYISYATQTTPTASTDQTHTSSSVQVDAYAKIVGLGGEFENNTQEQYNDLSGLFHLRLFGNSIQSTSLTASYGLRTRQGVNNAYRYSQQFGDGHLQIYILKHFGIEGRYRSYFSVNDETIGDTTGTLQEGGAFIDFAALRIFGTWYSEVSTSNKSGAETKTEHTGIKSGLKIFF